jgi:hypothetical protein
MVKAEIEKKRRELQSKKIKDMLHYSMEKCSLFPKKFMKGYFFL